MNSDRKKHRLEATVNRTLRWTLIIVGIVVVAAALLWGGMLIGRSSIAVAGYGPNMMGGYYPDQVGSVQAPYGMGPGMMGSGMMGYAQTYTGTLPYGPDMMGGMMGSGMMGGYSGSLYGVEPILLEQAQAAVEDYVAGLGNSDLTVGEVMIFDNHAYAQIVETSTGIGALEVLVDPVRLAVYPEYGPNMMWNQKYSPMGSLGGMMMGGGMMGRPLVPEASGPMPVSAGDAIQTAQRYLDTYLPSAKADEHATPFYGYYTLDILRDGQPVGMLSVNGYTQQVFVHTWHGDFVEMSEE
jgi:hypothetical protein